MVGKLNYLSHTMPNIAYAVTTISQFMHASLKSHLEALYKIIKYLKATMGKGVMFQRNGDLRLEAYIDVDWVGSIVDRRSTTQYSMFLGGNLITWRSKNPLLLNQVQKLKEAINIVHNLAHHDYMKHVEIEHFIKEKLETSQVFMPYISSLKQLVEILTKVSLLWHFIKC